MPKVRLYQYIVTGTGQFPYDMLRYDSAYPEREDQIWVLGVNRRDENYNVSRSMSIKSNYPPTTERWSSFGWRVSDVREIR